jgi:ribonuclease-3
MSSRARAAPRWRRSSRSETGSWSRRTECRPTSSTASPAAGTYVLAALLEAALAALYLEHGFEAIEHAVVAAFSDKIEYARSSHVDYKTELQEALARSGRQVHYTVLEVQGPPHDRRFVCAAHVAGAQLGIGRGSTKKAAEQEAAREALDALGVVPEQL